MAMREQGIMGERLAMHVIRSRGLSCMQPDLCYTDGTNWFVVESKCKKLFNVYGRSWTKGGGVPKYQIEKRLEMSRATNLRCKIMIFDFESRRPIDDSGNESIYLYEGWLDELLPMPDAWFELPFKNNKGQTEVSIIFNLEYMAKSEILYNKSLFE